MILSKSKILKYERCPWSYMKSYIEGLYDPPSEAMKRGTAIHKALEDFYSNPEILSHIKEHKPGLKLRLSQTLESIHGREPWIDFFADFNAQLLEKTGSCVPAIIEGRFKIKELGISGIVDRVDECEEGWVIIDYKSGGEKSKLSEENVLELTLYAMAIEYKYGGTAAFIGIYYTDHNKLVVERLTDEHRKETIVRIDAARDGIQQGHFAKCPGYWCRWCNFSRTQHCEHG